MPLYAQEDGGETAPAGDVSASGALPAPSSSTAPVEPIPDERSLRLDDGVVPQSPADEREGGSSAWALVRAILVLAVLAALVWLLLVFIRRRAARQAGASPHLKVLASTSVALNRHVHVVGLGSKAWLVGSSESAVNLIAEIEDQELIDQLRLEDSRRTALESTVAGNFSRLFSTLSGRGPGNVAGRGFFGGRNPAATPREGDTGESAAPGASPSAGGETGTQGAEALRRARERLSDL